MFFVRFFFASGTGADVLKLSAVLTARLARRKQ